MNVRNRETTFISVVGVAGAAVVIAAGAAVVVAKERP